MSAIIISIQRTTDGLYWRYSITTTGTYDIWLDGVLLAENISASYYDLLTSDVKPPPVEVCDYGARTVNAWASRQMTIQWFNDGYEVFAVQEWRSGAVYSTKYIDVPYPQRYCNTTVNLSGSASITQYWTVRPAVKTTTENYYITGAPVEITTRRHYMPRVPNPSYSYNGSTRKVTVS